MPLQDQLFSAIVSGAAPINPGVGGWDILIDQLSSDIRGRHGFGLLARLIGLTPTNGGDASILIAAPPGWNCMPFFVAMRRADGAGNPSSEYEFRTGTAATPLGSWYIRSGTIISLFTNKDFTLVFPSSAGGGIFATQPGQVPIVRGEIALGRNAFTVQRNNASGGSDEAIDFFVYGFAWQEDD